MTADADREHADSYLSFALAEGCHEPLRPREHHVDGRADVHPSQVDWLLFHDKRGAHDLAWPNAGVAVVERGRGRM